MPRQVRAAASVARPQLMRGALPKHVSNLRIRPQNLADRSALLRARPF